MDHALFEWDFENIQHIARHGVTPEETEEALLGPVVDMGYQDWHGELRESQLGTTSAGRVLQISLTMRGSRMRVVTAYDPERKLVRRYYTEIGG